MSDMRRPSDHELFGKLKSAAEAAEGARIYLEDKIKGCELYAFRWESKELGCIAYFKFALKDGALWISSLHRHRPRKEGD